MITFQYFNGCPNAVNTLDNLKQVMAEFNIPATALKIVNISDPSEASKFHFQGSPTIIINGLDIYSLDIPEGFSYSCRFYYFSGIRTGIIPTHFIRERIAKLYST